MNYFKFQFHYEDGQTEKTFSLWKKLCLATQDGGRLWHCYSTCLSHSSFEDLVAPSFEIQIWRYLWCFWMCPKQHCVGKQTFLHMVRIDPFAKLHNGSEIWINAMNNNVHLFVKMFLLFLVPNVKKITMHASIKILFLLKIVFYELELFY